MAKILKCIRFDILPIYLYIGCVIHYVCDTILTAFRMYCVYNECDGDIYAVHAAHHMQSYIAKCTHDQFYFIFSSRASSRKWMHLLNCLPPIIAVAAATRHHHRHHQMIYRTTNRKRKPVRCIIRVYGQNMKTITFECCAKNYNILETKCL